MPLNFWPKRRPATPVDPAFAAARAQIRAEREASKDADDWHYVLYYAVAFSLLVTSIAACVLSMAIAEIASATEKRVLWGLVTVSGATAVVMIAAKFFLAFVAAALPEGHSGFARKEAGVVAFLLFVLVCTQGLIGRSKIEVTAQDGESRYNDIIQSKRADIQALERQIADRRISANAMADKGYSWSVGQAKKMNVETDKKEEELQAMRKSLELAIAAKPPVSTKRAVGSGWLAEASTLAWSCAVEVIAAACAHVAGYVWSLGRRARLIRGGRLLRPAPPLSVPTVPAQDRTVSMDAVRSERYDGDGTVVGNGTVLAAGAAVVATLGAAGDADAAPRAPTVPTVPMPVQAAEATSTPTVPAGWTYTPPAKTVPSPTDSARSERSARLPDVFKSGRDDAAEPGFFKRDRTPAPAPAPAGKPAATRQQVLTQRAADAAKAEAERGYQWALDAVLSGIKPSVSKLQDHRLKTFGGRGSRNSQAENLRRMVAEGWIERGGRDYVLTAKAKAKIGGAA